MSRKPNAIGGNGSPKSPSPSPPLLPPQQQQLQGSNVYSRGSRQALGAATIEVASHGKPGSLVSPSPSSSTTTPSPSPPATVAPSDGNRGLTAPRRGGNGGAAGSHDAAPSDAAAHHSHHHHHQHRTAEGGPLRAPSANSSSSSSNDATSSNASAHEKSDNTNFSKSGPKPPSPLQPQQRAGHSPSPQPAPPMGSDGGGPTGSLPSGTSAATTGPRATTSELHTLPSPSPDATDVLSTGSGDDAVEPASATRGMNWASVDRGAGDGVVPPLQLTGTLRDSLSPALAESALGQGGPSASNPRSSLNEPSPSVPMAALQHPRASGSAAFTPSPSPPINLGSTTSGSLPGSATSSPSPGSGGSFSGNPRRTFNPAFLTLSPRADDDDGQNSESTPTAVLRLETDKGFPREIVQCDLTVLEERKVFVTQQCTALAKKMTSARIVETLLPALLTAFESDDYSESFDNCGPCIAAVLPQIIEALDDRSTATVKYFIGLIMELCCSAENTVLRDVTSSLEQIIGLLEDDVVTDLFLPLVLSMRVSFWGTPRAVAAGLLGCLAARPGVVRASERNIMMWFNCFVESSRDPCVLVREAAVKALHQWIRAADAHGVPHVEMPLPLVKEFVTDDLSDTVRYLLVQELVKLAKLMGREATSKHLQLVYASACGDPSWRVRFIAAQCMGDLIELVARPESFVRVLALLAEDEEPEIRAAVARQLPRVAESLPGEHVESKCVPVALRLGEDMDPVVRAAAVHGYASLLVLESHDVARAVCESVVHLMEDPSFAVQVQAIRSLEVIIQVQEANIHQAEARAAQQPQDDEASNSSANNNSTTKVPGSGSVRANAASRPANRKLKASQGAGDRQSDLSSSCGSNAGYGGGSGGGKAVRRMSPAEAHQRAALVVQSFMDRLESMSDAGNWRLRDAVVYILRFFCRAIREDAFVPLTQVIRVLLRDPVSEVRSRAIETLSAVAEHYGAEWAAQTTAVLLHEEFAPAQQQAYVWRVVAIQCLAVLLPVVNGLAVVDLRRQQLLNLTTELLQQYASDGVPNVRIAVARAMPRWHQWFASSAREQVVFNDAGARLQYDPDADVVQAAAAIQAIHSDEVVAGSGVSGRGDGRGEEAHLVSSYNEFTTPF